MSEALRKNCFIKVSGDLLYKMEVFQWIKSLNQEFFIVVCVGGGTQIEKALRRAGLPIGEFGPLGRQLKTFRQRQIARDALEKNQVKIQDWLSGMGIHVNIIIPVLEVGTVLCHVNGDEFLRLAYNSYDVLYAVTTKERVEKKKEFFKGCPKIQIVGF